MRSKTARVVALESSGALHRAVSDTQITAPKGFGRYERAEFAAIVRGKASFDWMPHELALAAQVARWHARIAILNEALMQTSPGDAIDLIREISSLAACSARSLRMCGLGSVKAETLRARSKRAEQAESDLESADGDLLASPE